MKYNTLKSISVFCDSLYSSEIHVLDLALHSTPLQSRGKYCKTKKVTFLWKHTAFTKKMESRSHNYEIICRRCYA